MSHKSNGDAEEFIITIEKNRLILTFRPEAWTTVLDIASAMLIIPFSSSFLLTLVQRTAHGRNGTMAHIQ